MAVNTCDMVVGRLIEIAVDAGYSAPEDVDTMSAMISARIASLPPTKAAVIAADWRGVHLMRPETSSRAHAMLTRVSPRLERSAILVSTHSSTEMLQFVRLVREAQHPSRRIFDSTGPMHAWLAESLSPSESARLATFLSRPAP